MKKSLYRCALACGTGISLFTPHLAHAQVPTPVITPQDLPVDESSAPVDPSEIIVTGTQIRGIKPIGSTVVTQSREDIRNTGKNDLNQVLAELPQAQFFLGLVQPGGGGTGGVGNIGRGSERSPVNRPNLRNIPGVNDGTGQPTLVLIDGHRVVPSGTFQSAIDAGVVPTGVLERNEILLDGASAIYGSDAVGGVINLITRKRYDGLEVNARYGFADDYWQRDFSATAGKTWGSGGFVINFDYAENSNILARDREYLRPINYLNPVAYIAPALTTPDLSQGYQTATVTGLSCDVPNVKNSAAAGAPIGHVSGNTVVSGPQYCWQNQWQTFVPAQKRFGLFLAGEQEITDGLKFDVTALLTRRDLVSNDGPITTTATVLSGNPNYPTFTAPAVNPLPGTQTVFYSLGPLLGYDTQSSRVRVEFFNVTPQLTADVGSWQVRGLVNFGQSKTTVDQVSFDGVALNSLITSGALNPYSVTSITPANRTAVENTLRRVLTVGKQQFTQVRLVGDGPLFSLPGGEVRAAIGAEWMQHKATQQLTTRSGAFPQQNPVSATTSSKSVFGEIIIPLVSSQNAMPLIAGLTLSASGRWDDYGQYGSTFNPRLAATYNPVDWITFRGSWSKSFRAPNAMDKLQTSSQVNCSAFSVTGNCIAGAGNPTSLNPAYNLFFTGSTYGSIVLTGTDNNLGPERSTNWSVGVDLDPPFVPGLKLSASYWEIHFKGQIATPGTNTSAIFQNAYGVPGNLTEICVNPNGTSTGLCTPEKIAAFIALGNGGSGQAAATALQSAGLTLAYLLDQRTTNLGSTDLAGVDASASYQTQTSFGGIDARVSASIPVKAESKVSVIRPTIDTLFSGTPDFRVTASLGATIGQFRAQATWRYSSSYIAASWACLDPTAGLACPTIPTRRADQIRIGQFDTLDLLFRYSINSDSWIAKDLDLTFYLNNVFNSHPPFERTATGGVAGGQTLGRLFQFGISKRF